jgi:hypothetical protein
MDNAEKRQPLWLLTGALLVLFPVLNFIYWPQVLRSGALPTDGDSIGIPMLGSILMTFVISPLFFAVAWLCLRRYNPKTRLAIIRRDRPIRTIAATLVFGGAVVFLVITAIVDLMDTLPWYDYLWIGYALIWVPWLLGLRAAVIDQHSAEQHSRA